MPFKVKTEDKNCVVLQHVFLIPASQTTHLEYVVLSSSEEQMGRKSMCLDRFSDKINRGKSVNLKIKMRMY